MCHQNRSHYFLAPMHLLAQSSETGKMPPSMPSNTSTMKTDMEHWFGFSFCKTIATNSHLVLHNGNPSCFQRGVPVFRIHQLTNCSVKKSWHLQHSVHI